MSSADHIFQGVLDCLAALEPGEAILVLDLSGHIRRCTTTAGRLLRLNRHQIRHSDYAMLFVPGPGDVELPSHLLATVAEAKQARHDGWLIRGDGSQFWGEICMALADDGFDQPAILVRIRDRTEAREVKQEAERARVLEATIATGRRLAHDCNNFLMIATNRLTTFKRQIDPADPAWRDLCDLDQALTRVGALVHQCLSIEDPTAAPRRTTMNLNVVVTKVANMLRGVGASDGQVNLRLDPLLESIEADPLGIEQVLVNLILNAKQAMQKGGPLTLETASVDIFKTISRAGSHVPPGRYARLAVQDSGCGMTPAVLARAFDPSVPGRSSTHGLGLSSCLRIVRGHGGEMTIDSEPGKGTRVDIYLPTRQLIELDRPPDVARNSPPQAAH